MIESRSVGETESTSSHSSIAALTALTSATFFELPSDRVFETGHVVMVGAPTDASCTEKAGSADAPRALRQWSRKVGHYCVSERTLMNQRRAAGVDGGDLRLDGFSPKQTFDAIFACTSAIAGQNGVPLLVGGDHSITYPALAAIARRYDDVRLIQFDAHHDATDPAEWKCQYNHGTWVRNLIADGAVRGEQIVQIGIRDFQWSASGGRFVRQHGISVFSMHDFEEELADFLKLLELEPARPTYVTFDIDCVDPAFAPGTGENMVGGFTSREVLRLVKAVFHGQKRIVGADLVEVAPSLDSSGRTCALASHLLALMVDGIRLQGQRSDQPEVATVSSGATG